MNNIKYEWENLFPDYETINPATSREIKLTKNITLSLFRCETDYPCYDLHIYVDENSDAIFEDNMVRDFVIDKEENKMNDWKQIGTNALDTLENVIDKSEHYELMASSPEDGDKYVGSNLIIQEKETGINIHITATLEEDDVAIGLTTKEEHKMPNTVNEKVLKWLNTELTCSGEFLEEDELKELKETIDYVKTHNLETGEKIFPKELKFFIFSKNGDGWYGYSGYYGEMIYIHRENKMIYKITPCFNGVCIIRTGETYDNLEESEHMSTIYSFNNDGLSNDKILDLVSTEVVKFEYARKEVN